MKTRRFLFLDNDGCNGLKRGDVVNAIPNGYFERNDGDGIWEVEGGGGYLVELRDDPARDLTDDDNMEEEEDL